MRGRMKSTGGQRVLGRPRGPGGAGTTGPRGWFPGGGAGFMRAEVVNHQNLGVPPALFIAFFGTVRDAFRELAGGDTDAPVAGSALLAGPGGHIGVMVNEEDHLRLQAMRSGFELQAAWAQASALDTELGETGAAAGDVASTYCRSLTPTEPVSATRNPASRSRNVLAPSDTIMSTNTAAVRSPKVQIGLPEVGLGLLPGAGGVVATADDHGSEGIVGKGAR